MNRALDLVKISLWAASHILILALCALPAFAQVDRGAIVGRIVDSSGAVVPNANVTVLNKATGVVVTTPANDVGEYQVLALIPGTYSIKVSAQGFEGVRRDDILLHVQDRLSIDFTLKVGSVNQEVVVTGSEPLLQTQTADVGNVVDSQLVNDLPLNGRRYADLALLEPGVQKFYAANNPAPDRFSVNGNLELQNNFLLNGIDNNSWSENLQEFSVQVVQPPPDAVQEFRVQTRTYSSEFGNSAGAVINATIKSGTNQYHGNLFEYLRNNVFDANSWINNRNNKPKGRFVQNQFGGTFGGPIIKDKTFFFGDLQRFTSRRSTTITSTVPTPLMKQGNFTELGRTLSASPIAGQAGCVISNVVQAGCIDPVATKLVALFPDPNIASQVALQGLPGKWSGAPNYIFSTTVPNDVYSLDGRVDHALNQNNHVYGSYSYYHVSRQDPPWTGNAVVGNGNFATQYRTHTQLVSLGWTRNIGTTMVNDTRLGFNRDFAHSDPIGVALGKSLAPDFGLTGIPETPNTAGLPPIEINGLTRLGTSPWRPQYQISQAYNFIENLSWLKSTHSFKFGYQYLRRSDNFLDIRAPQGELQINGVYTAGGAFGLADFLLGDVDATHFTTPLVVHYFQPGHSFYAMDTWRATPKLNLTYGLRYELFSPIMSRENSTSNFTTANGGGIVTAAQNASGWAKRALINPDKNDFAPRVGFAYQLTKKAVVRGGYGVFYQHYNRIGSESLIQLNPPFLTDVQVNRGVGSSTTLFQLKNGFPLSTFTGTALDLTKLQTRAQDPNQRSSYVEQVSFGPEIEVFQDTVLSTTYVGNWGRKMNRLRNANQGRITGFDNGCPIVDFPFANLNTVSHIDTLVTASPLKCSVSGQHAFLEFATNDGNTDYNGLEMSLRRRMSKGLAYAVNYTYSHGLANFGDNLTAGPLPQNAYNYSAEMSNSILDIRHRLVGNFTWDLPFGQGKRFLSSGGITDRVLGGWQFNGILTLQTGSPFTVTAPDSSFTGSNHAAYANCIGDPFSGATDSPDKYTTTGFFINPAAFAIPVSGTFGNCAPRKFHGPGIEATDLSLFKQIKMTERLQMQFRAEFFNAFNHPNFANPSANIAFPGSFGKVTNTLSPILGTGSGGPGDPREIQFALKLYF